MKISYEMVVAKVYKLTTTVKSCIRMTVKFGFLNAECGRKDANVYRLLVEFI